MVKQYMLAVASAAALLAAASVSSAATITMTGAPLVTGADYTLDFEKTGLVSAGAYGVSASGDFRVANGTSGTAAEPLGDTSNYLAVPSANSNGSATLSFDFGTKAVEDLSLNWGSIDAYNSFELLGAGGTPFQTISGSSYPPADGNQSSPSSTGYLNIALSPGEVLTGLKENSTQYALETDTYGFKFASAAPEPSTWLLMFAGIGGIGLMMRRAKQISGFRFKDAFSA